MKDKELVQKKFDRMVEIFESKEMAQKFLDVGPEKMKEYSDRLSEIRFDAQLDAAKVAKDQERYQELMLQVLPIHPLKEDALFIEAWKLASDMDIIHVAVNELEEEFEY